MPGFNVLAAYLEILVCCPISYFLFRTHFQAQHPRDLRLVLSYCSLQYRELWYEVF